MKYVVCETRGDVAIVTAHRNMMRSNKPREVLKHFERLKSLRRTKVLHNRQSFSDAVNLYATYARIIMDIRDQIAGEAL